MLMLIKSLPGSDGAASALRLAAEMKADVVFLQNGVYHNSGDMLQDIPCTCYFIEEDLRMRGLPGSEYAIGYPDLVDMIAKADKVNGIY